MTELTATPGDGNADRTGYWTVTGPQDEHDMYAIVERSRRWPDEPDGEPVISFAWYLHKRSDSQFNSTATFMQTIDRGMGATLEEAIEQLREAWPAEYVNPAPAPAPDPLQRLWPRTDA